MAIDSQVERRPSDIRCISFEDYEFPRRLSVACVGTKPEERLHSVNHEADRA